MQAPAPKTPFSRADAAIILFILCSLLSTARLLLNTPNPRHRVDDISRRSDQRFASLKARLPDYGVIGYLGETGDSATPDYYLAQYALAPLVVDHSPDHPIVIGNFPSSQPADIPPNLRLVQDFGNGVLLLARKDKP